MPAAASFSMFGVWNFLLSGVVSVQNGTDALSTHGLMRAGVLQLSRWALLDAVVG